MQYNTERIVNFVAKLPNGIAPNSRMLGINYCMEGNYKHRVVDALLERKLLGNGAVLVEGAKWCGKTTTSSRLAKSILKLGETSVLRSSRQLAEMNPALFTRISIRPSRSSTSFTAARTWDSSVMSAVRWMMPSAGFSCRENS